MAVHYLHHALLAQSDRAIAFEQSVTGSNPVQRAILIFLARFCGPFCIRATPGVHQKPQSLSGVSLRDGQRLSLWAGHPRAQAHPLKGKVTMFGIFKRKPAEQQLKLKSLRNEIGTGGY